MAFIFSHKLLKILAFLGGCTLAVLGTVALSKTHISQNNPNPPESSKPQTVPTVPDSSQSNASGSSSIGPSSESTTEHNTQICSDIKTKMENLKNSYNNQNSATQDVIKSLLDNAEQLLQQLEQANISQNATIQCQGEGASAS